MHHNDDDDDDDSLNIRFMLGMQLYPRCQLLLLYAIQEVYPI